MAGTTAGASAGRVVIAGGHGKIAQHLIGVLTARGSVPIALIRNPDHAQDVADLGAQPVVLDLEDASVDSVAAALGGADAAVFAAGAGPGSGTARKDTVDRAAAVLFAEAAERARVRRFVQISSFGAGEPVPDGTDDVFAAYLRAKAEAERDLVERGSLDWTILRPGRLTDTRPTGRVTLSGPPLTKDDVPRGDVAAVIAELLDTPATARQVLMLTSGSTPIAEAVATVAAR